MTGTRRIDAPEFKDLDRNIGRRIRETRAIQGWSQENLGDVSGISSQQISKYEDGTNSIAACRLWAIAEALKVPVLFFFENIESDVERIMPRRTLQTAQKIESIPDIDSRDNLLNLINSMSK